MSNVYDTGRLPILPLPANLAHLRVRGEILIDYENRKLLISNQQNELEDVTSWVLHNLNEADGNIINITIENQEVNLKDFLEEINNNINKNIIEAVDITDTSFYLKGGSIDELSLSNSINNKLEVSGFSSADNYTIPTKINGKISWVLYDGIGSTNGGIDDEAGNSSLDVAYGDVIEVTPLNNVLYLNTTKRQFSEFLSGKYTLVLPNSIYKYINLEYYLLVGENNLTMEYMNTIFFDSDSTTLFEADTRYILSFKSFDGGKTWMGNIQKFSNKYKGS